MRTKQTHEGTNKARDINAMREGGEKNDHETIVETERRYDTAIKGKTEQIEERTENRRGREQSRENRTERRVRNMKRGLPRGM